MATRGKQSGTGYFRAKEAFGCEYEGEMITVAAGELVPAGHPLLKGRDELFEVATPDHLSRWGTPATSKAKATE